MRITFVGALCLSTLIQQTSSIQLKTNGNNLHNVSDNGELFLAGINNKHESNNVWDDVFGESKEAKKKKAEKKEEKKA